MTEHQNVKAGSEKSDFESRSRLLMPVVEGHTLESEDVSSFLGIRLSSADEESDLRPDRRLS